MKCTVNYVCHLFQYIFDQTVSWYFRGSSINLQEAWHETSFFFMHSASKILKLFWSKLFVNFLVLFQKNNQVICVKILLSLFLVSDSLLNKIPCLNPFWMLSKLEINIVLLWRVIFSSKYLVHHDLLFIFNSLIFTTTKTFQTTESCILAPKFQVIFSRQRFILFVSSLQIIWKSCPPMFTFKN